LQKYVSCRRKKFLSPFTHLLTLRLHKEGINCTLKCNNNSFSTSKLKKPNNLWKGLYICTNEKCRLEYSATIKEIHVNADIEMSIYFQCVCGHERDEMKIRVTGENRKEIAKELMINGTMNVKSDHIIFNRDNIDVKGEMKKLHVYKITNDF
jgi:hypothetical protein